MNGQTTKHAWQIDRELRLSAIPLDRRTHGSNWYTSETAFPYGDDLIAMFWFSSVPGSGAPEIPYLEMVQAVGNKGYDVSAAERLLREGLEEAKKCGILGVDIEGLARLGANDESAGGDSSLARDSSSVSDCRAAQDNNYAALDNGAAQHNSAELSSSAARTSTPPKPAVSPKLRALTSELLHEIHYAPLDPAHPYWTYEHPATWEEVRAAMPAAADSAAIEGAALAGSISNAPVDSPTASPAISGVPEAAAPGASTASGSGTVAATSAPTNEVAAGTALSGTSTAFLSSNLEARIHAGWLGQLAGGAFGTAIEGYHTSQLEKIYGRVDAYITQPETVNDDVVYELAFLDAFERHGRNVTSRDIGREWVQQIPFGWSAEWVALHNMADGILPPESGSWRNPYSNWIGAQMRGMVCGLVAPARPMEAARLAHIDGVVSHAENGVYGEIYAAVLSALAFVQNDPRALLVEASRFIPKKSEYAAVLSVCLDTVEHNGSAESAWLLLDKHFERYNWIHAYPNIAAVIIALWFGAGDMSESFRILAHAGLDVDCNAGLVGTVLGIMNGVSEQWSAPLNDTLETYLAGKESLSIRALAARTARLAEHAE